MFYVTTPNDIDVFQNHASYTSDNFLFRVLVTLAAVVPLRTLRLHLLQFVSSKATDYIPL